MLTHRIGQSVRDKRKMKELQENFGPLFAPYLGRIDALESRIAELEAALTQPVSGGEVLPVTPEKRGPGRPPKQ